MAPPLMLRTCRSAARIVFYLLLALGPGAQVAAEGDTPAAPAIKECDKPCVNGVCNPASGQCQCQAGWIGAQCQHCGGRFRLTGSSGYLTHGPGNYILKTKCTWLIEGQPNTVLRLRFNHFATECNWDPLYVFDGDSIYAPLLAAFSGVIVPERKNNEAIPEVAATSGYALLHFVRDASDKLTGFNISYSINTCRNSCSGHGECKLANSSSSVACECSENWKGESCNIPFCTDNCGAPERGFCSDTKECRCTPDWQGPSCSVPVPANVPFWAHEEYPDPKLARASHKAVVHNSVMWLVGGYTFDHTDYQMVLAFDLASQEWIPLSSTVNSVSARYGHSLALHKDKLYMYGGKNDETGSVTNELWVFHLQNQSWAQLFPQAKKQYAVAGHSAHIVTPDDGSTVMLVIFGHCPIYGYISSIQEYNLDTNTWRLLHTNGALVQGGYGHSSVYDPKTRAIYVHGGYKAFSANKYRLTDDLYKYEVDTRMWTIRKDSGSFRYLHTAVIISGTMLVFGGNTHNDTSVSHDAKCFSSDFMAYDIACDHWSVLSSPDLHPNVNRFGHSAVLSSSTMFVFGGFNSLLLNDVLMFTPESCEAYSNRNACLAAGPGIRCVWSASLSLCNPWELATPEEEEQLLELCTIKTSNHIATQYRTPCASRMACGECTSGGSECMWCSSMKQCVDSNAYVASFPYGQCMEWYTMGKCPQEDCSSYHTCSSCFDRPGCGWCTDPSNTGKGQCIEGSSRGPMQFPHNSPKRNSYLEPFQNFSMCPTESNYNWSYVSCPACQCNGHSQCINESICEKCEDLTTGKNCDICISGYYGDPTNGGTCQPCKCNGHASQCNATTGKCFCTTKGIIGDECQLCDVLHGYLGNPLTGTCYYKLVFIGYQFTFRLNQEGDRYYTAINFVATPEKNQDLDLFIKASKNFNLNVTMATSFADGTQAGKQIPILSKTNIKDYKDSFSYGKFDFPNNPNITFFAYVSNFTWPIQLQIAFSQHSNVTDGLEFYQSLLRLLFHSTSTSRTA